MFCIYVVECSKLRAHADFNILVPIFRWPESIYFSLIVNKKCAFKMTTHNTGMLPMEKQKAEKNNEKVRKKKCTRIKVA